MARYTDANCKLCRREGQKLFLKGEDATAPSAQSKEEIMLRASMARPGKSSLNMDCS